MEANKKPIALKVHQTEDGIVVGACDKAVLGKKMSKGGLVIEISEGFYFDRHATLEELMSALENCTTANLVGERTIEAYCRVNPEARKSVRLVCGVPHLQIFSV